MILICIYSLLVAERLYAHVESLQKSKSKRQQLLNWRTFLQRLDFNSSPCIGLEKSFARFSKLQHPPIPFSGAKHFSSFLFLFQEQMNQTYGTKLHFNSVDCPNIRLQSKDILPYLITLLGRHITIADRQFSADAPLRFQFILLAIFPIFITLMRFLTSNIDYAFNQHTVLQLGLAAHYLAMSFAPLLLQVCEKLRLKRTPINAYMRYESALLSLIILGCHFSSNAKILQAFLGRCWYPSSPNLEAALLQRLNCEKTPLLEPLRQLLQDSLITGADLTPRLEDLLRYFERQIDIHHDRNLRLQPYFVIIIHTVTLLPTTLFVLIAPELAPLAKGH